MKQFGIKGNPGGSPYKTHIPTVEDYFRSENPADEDPSVAEEQTVEDSDAVKAALSQIPGLQKRMHKK